MLTTGMTLKKEPKEFTCHCIKAWSGETSQAHIKSVGLTGDDATTTKYILNTLEGHYSLYAMGMWWNRLQAASTRGPWPNRIHREV